MGRAPPCPANQTRWFGMYLPATGREASSANKNKITNVCESLKESAVVVPEGEREGVGQAPPRPANQRRRLGMCLPATGRETSSANKHRITKACESKLKALAIIVLEGGREGVGQVSLAQRIRDGGLGWRVTAFQLRGTGGGVRGGG